MDDPIFDPWSVDTEETPAEGAPATPLPRWRSRMRPAPRAAPPVAALEPEGAVEGPRDRPAQATKPRARLSGAPGFLRTMAVSRLSDIVRQLELARHQAQVEDLLESSPPVLRLRFRPWRGPWTAELSPPAGVLEIRLAQGADGELQIRQWLDVDSGEPSEDARIPISRLSGAWLESLALEFVERVLSRA